MFHEAAKKPDTPNLVAPPQEPLQADASLLPAVSSPAARTVDIWEGLTRAANIVSEARNVSEVTKNPESASETSYNSNVENRRTIDKRVSTLFKDDIFLASDMYSWSRAKEAAESRDDDDEDDEEEEYFRQSLDSIISADKMLKSIEEDEQVDSLLYSRNATVTVASSNQSQAEWSGRQRATKSAVTIRKYTPAELASAQQPTNAIDDSKYGDNNLTAAYV